MKEITAKVLLSSVKQPDTWFGLKYNMNLYIGCQHQCIYCDSRSECYRIEDFNNEVLVKANALELLRQELAHKRIKGTIGTGSMNDPYMSLEKQLNVTGRALQIIAEYRFPVHIITKGDLVVRDVDILSDINRVYAAVSFTITTADDDLAKKLEPGAPSPTARFQAMQALAARGILTGITMMPILPYLEDNEANITAIISRAHDAGASYILPGFGMTLRDRQRDYYYHKLDKLFPGLSHEYERRFGTQYDCVANQSRQLQQLFRRLCERYGIATRLKPYQPETPSQLGLW